MSAAPAIVGVLGGGRMGAGIAHAFLMAGSSVTVVEHDEGAADAALARIVRAVDRSLAAPGGGAAGGAGGAGGAGAAPRDRDALLSALDVTTDIARLAPAELVVEAIFEDEAAKLAALARVEAQLRPAAALASNTSSIGIDRLAAGVRRPERLIGLHFFNPVPSSALVEVVVGSATDDALVARARDWVAAIGKTAITVRDSPGFASSRLGVALGLEAIRMLEEGVASAADIDAAMELGYRHPLGPLRTTDLVGLDVRLGIAEQLHRELGPRFEPPALLRRMVAEGLLGRKSGAGFYRYDEEKSS